MSAEEILHYLVLSLNDCNNCVRHLTCRTRLRIASEALFDVKCWTVHMRSHLDYISEYLNVIEKQLLVWLEHMLRLPPRVGVKLH